MNCSFLQRALRACMCAALSLLLCVSAGPGWAYAATAPSGAEMRTVVAVTSSADMPQSIAENQTVELKADIALAPGQTIDVVEGVLDGKGHTVTLADAQLARTVSGTIQNLHIESASTLSAGAFAGTLSGTIRACSSATTHHVSGFDDLGAFVDTLAGGTIANSYSAGTNTSMFAAGFASAGSGGTIANCLYTQGDAAKGMFCSLTANVSKKVNEDELASPHSVDYLNTDIADTGFMWALPDEHAASKLPVLVEFDSSAPANKEALSKAVDEASRCLEGDYSPATWAVFSAALEKARAVLADPAARQTAVDQAVRELSEAKGQLSKARPTTPCAPPDSGAIHIASADDLKAVDLASPDAYFVLDNDIAIDRTYQCSERLAGVLDGAGHTITFTAASSLFDGVAPTGVVQNLHFAGTFDTFETSKYLGPLGNRIEGAVVNCSSEVAGTFACGFSKRLSDGTLSNCYSISTGTSGALVSEFEAGVVSNVYWQQGARVPDALRQCAVSSREMAPEAMKTKEFAALLNEQRGAHGTAWGQSATGYPHFGADEEYNPDPKPEYGSSYPLTFTAFDSSVRDVPADGTFSVSPDEVDPTFHMAGTFQLVGVPETSTVSWALENVVPEQTMLVNLDSGQLRVDGEGSGVLVATEHASDGTSKTVARILLTAQSRAIAEMRLFIDGTDVTNSSFCVSGSEQKTVSVKVRYEGEDAFVDVAPSRFAYQVDDSSIIYSSPNSSAFYFTEPGRVTMTVTSRTAADVAATVALESAYVPVKSVAPAVSGTVTLHGRNANSSGGMDFLPDYAGVIVEPANASAAAAWEIRSSDPSVAEYVSSMVKGYVAYKAGGVRYTATIVDRDPATGIARTVEGSSTVVYEYLNPLSSLTCETSSLSLSPGERLPLDLTFEGPRSKDGYSVSEPGIVWTYDTEGIVSVERSAAGQWVHDPSSPENFMYLPNRDYAVTALAPGTVRVKGTPVDASGDAQPVAFTVTVSDGSAGTDETMALVNDGIASAVAYIDAKQNGSYSFNDEWEVMGLLSAGQAIDSSAADAYMESVAAAASGWDVSTKPTEIARVALAVNALGRDASAVGSVDLEALLWNSTQLDAGSNEAAWALIALDACKSQPSPDSSWSTQSMIDALLGFQCADGGFGLYTDKDSGIDTTAMALKALAAHRDAPGVTQAISRALDYLRAQVKSTGFGTSEADAQVLVALCALGVDPLEPSLGFGSRYANLVTSISSYRVEGADGFAHTVGGKPQAMSTVQALQGLVAYRDATFDEVVPVDPAVKAVQDAIDAIGVVGIDSRDAIMSARAAYAALSASQREQVDASALFEAETAYGTIVASTFTDVEGHWIVAEQWLTPALGRGIMSGYTAENAVPTGLFGPDDRITRAQAAVIAYRLANPASHDTVDPDEYAQTSAFADVAPGEYYTAAVNWCAEQGIVSGRDGFGENRPYCPDDFVTREELAKILSNTARHFGVAVDVADPSAVLGAFPDASDVSAWATSYLAWCVESGLIGGSLPAGTLLPSHDATRAEAAKMFVQLVSVVEDPSRA